MLCLWLASLVLVGAVRPMQESRSVQGFGGQFCDFSISLYNFVHTHEHILYNMRGVKACHIHVGIFDDLCTISDCAFGFSERHERGVQTESFVQRSRAP
jgi:drug/metabolite transporter superfamily protein YnfA